MADKRQKTSGAMEKRRRSMRMRIQEKRLCSISELANEFAIRKEIVTSDLDALQEQDMFIRRLDEERIVYAAPTPADEKFFLRFESKKKEKKAIGKHVFDKFINEGSDYVFDGSTTAFYPAVEIGFSNMWNLDVTVTNLFFLNPFKKISDVKPLPGGALGRNHASLRLHSEAIPGNPKYQIAIMGFDGISYEKGIYASPDWAITHRTILKSTTDLIILVGTHEKIGKTPRAKIISFEELDRLPADYKIVTDDNFADDDQEAYSVFLKEKKKFPAGKVDVVRMREFRTDEATR